MTFSDNETVVTWFTLSGFVELMEQRVTIFSLSALCYCMIVMVNIALIMTIIMDENLHEPMYIFLCNLCVSGLYGATGFYPKFLLDLLSPQPVISFAGCLIQSLVMYSCVCADIVILAVMAYDRHVAICRPLEYHSVMTKQWVTLLVSYPWVSTMCLFSTGVIITSRLKLCGSQIDRLYCANWSIVTLSCASTTANTTMGYLSVLFFVAHVILILCFYANLFRSRLKSIENWRKFMQTCVPHLLTLLNVAVASLLEVVFLRGGLTDLSKILRNFMSLQFLLFPPLLNPLIYGFQLKLIRKQLVVVLIKTERKKQSTE